MNIDGVDRTFELKDALIQIAKFRGGETGVIEVDFNGISQRFTDKKDNSRFDASEDKNLPF